MSTTNQVLAFPGTTEDDQGLEVQNGYEPSQWTQQPQLFSIMEQVTAQQAVYGIQQGGSIAISPAIVTTTYYFFDAVFRAETDQDMEITRHPIQNGANSSDHAYLQPTRIILEIGMSDSMASYSIPNVNGASYTQASSKTASAFQAFLALQARRNFLQVTTRLSVWQNMLIKSIRAIEDEKTLNALKAVITFDKVFTGQVSTTIVSARPMASSEPTVKGPQQPQSALALVPSHQVTTPSGSTTFSSGTVNSPWAPGGAAVGKGAS